MREEQLHNGKVAAGAGERQGCVVVVARPTVDVGATTDEELDCAQVT